MDYEKKYKEALNWMRSIYPTLAGSDKEDAEHYFPELKESKDERIRKEIKHHISLLEFYRFMTASKEECLAYLEKQKEQKPAEWRDRLKDEIKHLKIDVYDQSHQFDLGARSSLTFLESFLDSLPDEPVMGCEDLEEAAKEYDEAESWRYEALKYPRREAFEAGANWQKRKMLKNAVEGEVCILPGHVAYVKEKDNKSLKQYLLDHFKTGNKVRIIIVKEEEE